MPPSADICVAAAILLVTWEQCFLGIVRGLEIRVDNIPPIMAREAKAVCGISWPKTTVAPINGAPNSQKRAQQMVEKARIFFFSLPTNSTVQVVNMASVQDMAALDTMADIINNATRLSISTATTKIFIKNHSLIENKHLLNKLTIARHQPTHVRYTTG